MASGLSSAEVIVVQSRQIIVNQGISVDKFDGASGMKRGRDIADEDAGCLQTQDRANTLATGEHTVTHYGMNGSRLRRCSRKAPLDSGIDNQAALFEKWGKFHLS